MANKAKQLVSVRLNADDLQVIDDWVKGWHYRKRSDVVDGAVRLAAWMIQNGYAEKLVQFNPRFDSMEEFQMSYRRKWQ